MAFGGLAYSIDRRAERALDKVVDVFTRAARASDEPEQLTPLSRRIRPSRADLVPAIDLSYRVESRFLSRTYDFEVRAMTPRSTEIILPAELHLVYEGKLRVKGASFAATGDMPHEIESALAAEGELTGIIRQLNLTNYSVQPADGVDGPCWMVTTRGLLGSSSWVLIPPVFNTIWYRPDEAAAHLKLVAITIALLREVDSMPGGLVVPFVSSA